MRLPEDKEADRIWLEYRRKDIRKEKDASKRLRSFSHHGDLEEVLRLLPEGVYAFCAGAHPRLGAFSTSDLDKQLTNLGVTTLIVSGAHTSGTVLSTVREAADRDYRLIILSDCCADPDIEVHRLLMARIFPRQAEITSAAELYLSLAADKAGKQRAVDVGQPSHVR